MENQLAIVLSKNKLLKNVDILKINLSEIKGKLITVGEGEILYREGDPSNTVFLVISGEINVIKKRLLGKTKSYIFIEDDFFGHEEYFEETSRTSTAVALRDSYLISLSSDEIDNLIKQDNRVNTNLHEPIEEMEDDFTPYEKPTKLEETIQSRLSSDKPEELQAPEIKKSADDELKISDDDYFKSIADVSMSDEKNVIQPLEELAKSNRNDDEYELISFNDDDLNEEPSAEKSQIFNDDGIPKSEFDHSDFESNKTQGDVVGENKFEFDESAFLNEDGIPKAEFEIPDNIDESSNPPKRKTQELDDALFQILSGGSESLKISEDNHDKKEPEQSFFEDKKEDEIPHSENVDIKNDDMNFYESFQNEPVTEIQPSKFEIEQPLPIKEIESQPAFNYDEIPLNVKKDMNKEVPAKKTSPPVVNPENVKEKAHAQKNINESDDILAEAEEQLRRIEKGEPVDKSMNWRTLSDDGGEMNTTHLNMIIKAAELVNSTIKIDEVLSNVVEVATSLTNSDRGTLYIIDREKNELWSMVAMGKNMKEIRLKIGEGLAGYVGLSGEVINIKNVQSDPRFKADYDKASGYTTKNMICFPIKNNKNEIIGVLQLLNSKNGEFSKLDENFLNAISIHAAIALQNAAMVEKLLQSERVQSLGKMANFLIQDIKKPILVSKRYSEHLKTKSLSPDIAQVIDMLLDQLTQVADLVQTTSSYSEGKTMLRILNVSLNNTLTDYASRIGTYVESRNCFIKSHFDKDITIKLDVKEFYQCYLHIVKNACDAMPEGGEIEISTKREDRKVKIFFKDKGLGIPEGFKDKIFEPFMSYGKKEGTGLGLSITKKVVEAHNGTIDVQSSLGEGATFIISLPAATSV